MDVVYFVVLVGVLIFVHELGHFAWAKFFGVRVLRFSLGFGPRLAGFRLGETEYVLAALPLGGYVKMLGESPHDVVSQAEMGQSFQAQSLFRRVVIVLAGPAMNLLFPVVLFFLVSLGDTHLPAAVIGTVLPEQPADGRLLPGDRVVAIDGESIATFDDFTRIVSSHPGQMLEFQVERRGQVVMEQIVPVREARMLELERMEIVGMVGVGPDHAAPVVGVLPSSPAAAVGMKTFDVIVAVHGRPTHRFIDLERALDSQIMIPIAYLRPTALEDPLGGWVDLDVYEPRWAAVTPTPGRGIGPLRAGIESADLYVSHVRVGSPEHQANILPGDRVVTLDGAPVRLWSTMLLELRSGGGRPHTLSWRRGEELFEAELELEHERGETEHGQVYDRYRERMRNWMPRYLDPAVENESRVSYAMREAWKNTQEMVELTVFSVVRLLEGRLSVKSIGGPLTIFDVAGSAAREGAVNYLALMAFISVNLGLINLLPIPLLDGGHLLFFLVEAVTRRRIGTRAREYASLAGLFVLLLIMILAFKNDLERFSGNDRLWPDLSEQLLGD